MYIKIGDIILNRDAIAYIELDAKMAISYNKTKRGVKITMMSQEHDNETGTAVSDKFFFEDEDAEAIRWFFNREGSRDFADVQQLFDADQKKINESEQSDEKIWL